MMTSLRGRFDCEIVVRGGINAVLHAPFWEHGRTHHYVAASDGSVFRVERSPGWRFVRVVSGDGEWRTRGESCTRARPPDDEIVCFSPLTWVVVATELAGDLPVAEDALSCRGLRSKR